MKIIAYAPQRGMIVTVVDADVVLACAALRAAGFSAHVESARGKGNAPWEPWPSAVGEPDVPSNAPGLVRALNAGLPGTAEPAVAAALRRLDLADGDGHDLRPGGWEVTSFAGVLAVRDRARPAGHGEVYIGEDGLRFAAALTRARPSGNALDVGCGSGIVAATLARTCTAVTGIDVVPECVEASRMTARLNDVADRVTIRTADLLDPGLDDEFAGRFDCVAANLPGVPVPTGLAYSPAGDGGPDGLRLFRALFERIPAWVRHRPGPDPVLLLRFQSLGDGDRPFLLADIATLAARQSWDVEVVADSRVSADVRGALTAHYARELNRDRSVEEILALVDAHVRSLHATDYYSSTLVARPGDGHVTFVDAAVTGRLDQPMRLAPPRDLRRLSEVITYRYYSSLHRLPDGYWELADQRTAAMPMQLLQAVGGRWSGTTATLRSVLHDVAHQLFAAAPLRARALYTTAGLLLDVLVAMGLAEEATPA